MTVEDFLSSSCLKKGLNPAEHFVRVKKKRDMASLKYFVPHRSDLIETYVSNLRTEQSWAVVSLRLSFLLWSSCSPSSFLSFFLFLHKLTLS